MPERVAILIPSVDNRSYLEPCLRSIRDYTQGARYHLCVINNGEPESCRWIDDPAVHVIQAGGNIGWERGLELGLKRTRAPYVLFLNDDTLILRQHAGWLASLAGDLEDPRVAAAGPASNTVAGPQSVTQSLQPCTYSARFLIGFCLLVKRSALLEVGGIDCTLPGGDDIDLSIRLRKAGYTLVCDRRVYVYHYGYRTGARLHGGPEVPGGWNSLLMTGMTRAALIDKHGQAALEETWRNDPLGPYVPPRSS